MDEFDAWFGAPLEEEDEDEPLPPPPAEDDGSVVAEVVTVLRRQCVMRTPDGGQHVVDQPIFERLERGARCVLFLAPEGYSLIDPRWEIPDVGSRGAHVPFVPHRYDPLDDVLCGERDGVGYTVARAHLPWPLCLPGADLAALVGQEFRMAVLDPSTRPVRLAHGLSRLEPDETLRLLALNALAQRAPEVEARTLPAAENARAELFGRRCCIFLEDLPWRRDGVLPPIGSTAPHRLTVDLFFGSWYLSHRRPTDPEWAIVRARHPVGSVVEDASVLAQGPWGFSVRLADGDLQVYGMAAVDGIAPHLPTWPTPLVPPRHLEVIGYDESRCRLLLAPAAGPAWRTRAPAVGDVIPVHAYPVQKTGQDMILWGVNSFAEATASVEAGPQWARVVDVEPNAERLVVEPLGRVREGHVAIGEEGARIEFPGGLSANVYEPGVPDGAMLEATLHKVRFPADAHPELSILPPREAADWKELEAAHAERRTLHGVVTDRVKGGLTMQIALGDGRPVHAFLPGSQVDLRPVKNLQNLVGQEYDVQIIQIHAARRNLIVSRVPLLEAIRAHAHGATLAHIRELQASGAVPPRLRGRVKGIVDYGAFVDLGGMDGLIHITDLAWKQPDHPSELLELGQEIEVALLKFDEEADRVWLGLKQLVPDPWETLAIRCPVGSKVRGKVVSIPDYGAFVAIGDGVEGLVHISEMSWNKRIRNPAKLVTVGEEVEAVVLEIDEVNKRVRLGMRQLLPDPWEEAVATYPVGSTVHGPVVNVTDFGVFLGMADGIDGMVHVSDMAPDGRPVAERYSKGDPLEAWVVRVDPERRHFQLSLLPRPPVLGTPPAIPAGSAAPVPEADAVVIPRVAETTPPAPTASVIRRPGESGGAPPHAPASVGPAPLVPAPPPATPAPTAWPSPTRAASAPWRPGQSVSLDVLGARMGLKKADLLRWNLEAGGDPLQAWKAPLRAGVAARIEALAIGASAIAPLATPAPPTSGPVSAARAPIPATAARPAAPPPAKPVTPGMLGARLHLLKPELLRLLEAAGGDPACAWTTPLPPALVARIEELARANVPAEAPRTPSAAMRPPPGADTRPAPVAAIESAPLAPLSARTPAPRDRGPGLDFLRRVAVPAAPDDEEDDDLDAGLTPATDAMGVKVPPAPRPSTAPPASARPLAAGSLTSAPMPRPADAPPSPRPSAPNPASELARRVARWADGEGDGTLGQALAAANLDAFASLLDPSFRFVPAEPWEAASLLGPVVQGPVAVDRALRALAADPGELLAWSALRAALPPASVPAIVERVDTWLARQGRGPAPARLRAATCARAAVDTDDLPEAHALVGDALLDRYSEDLHRLRREIVERHRERTLARETFYGIWRRRHDAPAGRGGFAVVLPVTRASDGARHALKIALLQDVSAAEQAALLGLFDREARFLERASGHPALPRFVARPEQRAIVTEWIDARPLSEVLPTAGGVRWPAERAAALGLRLAGALVHLDRTIPGFVHNDIAPRNVLASPERPEQAVLLDFGLAAHTDSSITSYVDDLNLRLDECYQAPEVRSGDRGSPQSDMYALGVVVNQLCSGDRHRHPTPRLDTPSGRLDGVLTRLLDNSPARRPRTWGEVVRAFSEVA